MQFYLRRRRTSTICFQFGDDLTDDLLNSLQYMAVFRSESPEVQTDMNEACEILVPVYKNKDTSGKTQRLIRDFMRVMGKERYEQLWEEVR